MALSKSPVFSFRTILFATAIVGAVPTIIFSGILLQRYAQSERARAEHVLTESTKGLARGIDTLFLSAESALLALRDSDALEKGDLLAFEQRLRRTANTTGRHYALFDRSGRQLINTFLPVGAPLPSNPESRWADVFTQNRTIVTNVFTGLTSKRLLAGVAVPVIQNNKVKWALAAGLFEQDFAGIISKPGVPNDWIVSIVDRTGRHMIRSHNNDKFAGKPLVPSLINLMKSHETGPLRTVSLEGIPLISTVQYAPISGWAAAVGLPVAALEAPMQSSLNQLLLTGLAVAGLAVMLALMIARLLDRAMLSLTSAAAEIGSGKEIEPPASPVKEVRMVAGVMAETSHALHRLTTSLETQVAARTAELSETNARLTAEMQRRRDSESQLMQMQKIEAIGHLTGGIAHDFNNMLAVVLSSLRLLERRLRRGEADVQRYVDAAIAGAERAAELTARLLAFSRQQPLAPEVIDGSELIPTMGEILRRTIPENIRIETVLPGGLWRIFADRPGLESAIINLAVNARDAMPDGGTLMIESCNVVLDENYAALHPDVEAGEYLMIRIADTGSGMPSDVVRRAFDPFFTTKPAGQGTGLGLSQVHGFITQSGGHIDIDSTPGKGTTVRLYFPRHIGDGAASDRRNRQAKAQASRPRGVGTILVVEDEQAVRRLTVEMLHELGYATLDVESGERALKIIDAHPEIALLITDIVMPDMNGRKLADAVLARRPGLPVLFSTGYTGDTIMHHGVLEPGVHVIFKPYSLEVLAAKLTELLRPAETVEQGPA